MIKLYITYLMVDIKFYLSMFTYLMADRKIYFSIFNHEVWLNIEKYNFIYVHMRYVNIEK